MPSYPPTDTMVSSIATALISVVTTQIGGVGKTYTSLPPGPPPDNSVVVNLLRWKSKPATNGKTQIDFIFLLMHFFRYSEQSINFSDAYLYVPSYIRAYESWGNQSLGGLSRIVSITDGGVMQESYAGQPYIVLAATVHVSTEIATPTS